MLPRIFLAALLVAVSAPPALPADDDKTSILEAYPEQPAAPGTVHPAITLFSETEPVVAPSPGAATALELPLGTAVDDFEVSPLGQEVAVLVEDGAKHQRLAYWRMSESALAGTIDVPQGTRISSLTWHPSGRALFLLATAPAGSEILRLDRSAAAFSPGRVLRTEKQLRRLVVGPRPFEVANEKAPVFRLFFGERHSGGGFALRSITENGKLPYTVIGPAADPGFKNKDEEARPRTEIAPSALPVAFHPAGNLLIWEDANRCLHKSRYEQENWAEKSEPIEIECGQFASYAPNGTALLVWQGKRAGVRLKSFADKSERPALATFTLESPPSHTPDGKGVVAVTTDAGKRMLRYLPIEVPLAEVVNAWMFAQDADDVKRLATDRALFRTLGESDQLYKLYDSESYACGEPDAHVPTRPYLVTTDLFWEVYGAAFDGLFIVVEREQAIPAFQRFLAAAEPALNGSAPGTPVVAAFAAARAVLEGRGASDAEGRLILAAKGVATSPALGVDIDYAQFRPRGHYRSETQKRYFAAMRYLSQIAWTGDDLARLKSLDAAVAKAAADWIAAYRPFIAPSRLDLVWDAGSAKASIASHPGGEGARLFPLSWGWDNEVLDNAVFHSAWPEAEQIVAKDGSPRLLPSGLDFAAAAGSGVARNLLEASGILAQYPNLGPRLAALGQRFAAVKAGSGTLYEDWLAALATQWADGAAEQGVMGPVWAAKRLQTGLASWATLRHSTVLVNDQTVAECGEGGFEPIVLRPPRGYVEPDPQTFAAIAGLFDKATAMVRVSHFVAKDAAADQRLREGIERRLAQSRDDARGFQRMAEKELRGEALTPAEYKAIQYVGGAAEHNFLIFSSLAQPDYALSAPDPMMKVADVAGSPGGSLEVAVGRPLEWDQVVPFYGRAEVVKGAVYAYYELASAAPLDDAKWRAAVDQAARPPWIARFMAEGELECPANEP